MTLLARKPEPQQQEIVRGKNIGTFANGSAPKFAKSMLAKIHLNYALKWRSCKPVELLQASDGKNVAGLYGSFGRKDTMGSATMSAL